MIGALVDTGHININNVEQKRNEQPALSYAAENGLHSAVTKLLKIEGIQVDGRDSNNATPLLHAAREGHKEVMEILLARPEVDVNAEDDDKETPYSQAKKLDKNHKDRKEIMKMLREKGARTNGIWDCLCGGCVNTDIKLFVLSSFWLQQSETALETDIIDGRYIYMRVLCAFPC